MIVDIRGLLLSNLKKEYDKEITSVIWLMFKNGGSSGIYEGVANVAMAETAYYFAGDGDIVCTPRYNLKNYQIHCDEWFDITEFKGKKLEIGIDEFSQMDKWLFDHIEEYRGKLIKASAIITNQCTEYVEKIAKELKIPIVNVSTKQQTYFNNKINIYNLMELYNIACPSFKICKSKIELNEHYEKMHKNMLVKSTDANGKKIIHPIKDEVELRVLENKISFPCIIEPLYNTLKSYNFQFYINDSINVFLGSSIQLVKHQNGNIIHAGNIVCTELNESSKSWEQCYNLSSQFLNRFKECGYFGIVGLDIIETTNGELLLVDINPRFNASTFMYSTIISKIHSSYKMFFFIKFKYKKDWYIATKKNMDMLNSIEKGLKCWMVFSPVIIKNEIYLNLLAQADSKEQLVLLDKTLNDAYGVDLKIMKNINGEKYET